MASLLHPLLHASAISTSQPAEAPIPCSTICHASDRVAAGGRAIGRLRPYRGCSMPALSAWSGQHCGPISKSILETQFKFGLMDGSGGVEVDAGMRRTWTQTASVAATGRT